MGFGIETPKQLVVNFPNFIGGNQMNKYQYITINNSSIGSFNTGSLKNVDISIGNLANNGNNGIATDIKTLVEAIVNHESIDDKQKNTLVEQIAFISGETIKNEVMRNKTVGKSILDTLNTALSVIPQINEIWQKLFPAILQFF